MALVQSAYLSRRLLYYEVGGFWILSVMLKYRMPLLGEGVTICLFRTRYVRHLINFWCITFIACIHVFKKNLITTQYIPINECEKLVKVILLSDFML